MIFLCGFWDLQLGVISSKILLSKYCIQSYNPYSILKMLLKNHLIYQHLSHPIFECLNLKKKSTVWHSPLSWTRHIYPLECHFQKLGLSLTSASLSRDNWAFLTYFWRKRDECNKDKSQSQLFHYKKWLQKRCGFFCSPKLPYLSAMSQQFCHQLHPV